MGNCNCNEETLREGDKITLNQVNNNLPLEKDIIINYKIGNKYINYYKE